MTSRDYAAPDENSLRQALSQAVRLLDMKGLNTGTSGNVSARIPGGDAADGSFCITPAGLEPADTAPETIVRLSFSGRVDGAGRPSSEWRMHRDILRDRPEVNAVVHTHAVFATTLACLHREIPAFHYKMALVGGSSIRCAPYALFGSQQLSSLALEALQGRNACLLGNHGMVALGRSVRQALALCLEVETLCEQYWRILQVGEPVLLTEAQIQEAAGQFSHYGLL
ncbi:MAG: class II aldolase/adducin family protein [Candidatus Adiutrix sp.]|jgi:L-fuculose-phosphate aldolase|nr:class II aldolase/adducin family protein [Candidatus Adiutrix sp.]